MLNDLIEIEYNPAIPGLSFRRFRGAEDYPKMAAVIAASTAADKIERVTTEEDIANSYAHLINSDPYQDMIFPEINGETIGYARCFWFEEANGPYLFSFIGYIMPTWRRKGIGRTMLRWMEQRLRATSASHTAERENFFQGFTSQEEVGQAIMLEREGYQPVRYFWEMLRPSLDDIPDFPLPEGLEVRPVTPDHYRPIWDANTEAFHDHWGFVQPTEEMYKRWQENKTIFQPHLWQIAWEVATDQIAGQVRTFIDHAVNRKYNRRRGQTELISVRRPWRKRGLARALIVRSLRAQKEAGMTESALGVDSQNLSGATRVYEACGFRVVKQSTVYHKAL